MIRSVGNVFCAGNDLNEFSDFEGMENPTSELFIDALAKTTAPVIAAVQGKAVGFGATMLLHCDFIIASMDVQLIFPFIDLGVVPEAGSTLLMPQLMGYQRALRFAPLGEPLLMDESLQMGMITKCSCIDELESDAFNIARVLSQKPYKSLTHTKRLFKQGSADLLQQHIQLEMEAFGICLNYRAPASGLGYDAQNGHSTSRE